MPKFLVVGKEDNGYPTDAENINELLQNLSQEELDDILYIYEMTDVTPKDMSLFKTAKDDSSSDKSAAFSAQGLPGWWGLNQETRNDQ